MKKLAFGALLVGLFAACGGDDGPKVTPIDGGGSGSAVEDCNPLTQAGCAAGEKCTWLLDALMPSYVGHVGCAPDGTAAEGAACMYGAPGATGYDNCVAGTVCGNYRMGAGVCKTICDQQGGTPACASTHVCVTYSGLFSTGDTTPAAAGVCDLACDPIGDNDFDGSGSASAKTGTTCGTAENVGCYGYPSGGTPPSTGWSCTGDFNFMTAQPTGLRHRVRCEVANECADAGPTIYTNSCNQGYIPLLRESTTVSTAVCIALCKPLDCYDGGTDCGGTGAPARLGQAPHRCNAVDRVGTFASSPDGGEHCQYMWYWEIDDQGMFLESASSDTLGICFDHSKYQYDSNGDNMPDTNYPACSILTNPGFGSGSNPADVQTYWGAADIGCVSTTTAGIGSAAGKSGKMGEGFVKRRPELPRALYHRTMNAR